MRILCTGDWHSDHITSGVPRHQDVREAVLGYVVPAAIKEKVDLFVFGGDLCDPGDGPDVLRAGRLALEAAQELDAAEIPQLWMSGNHDVVEDGGKSPLTVLEPLKALARSDVYVADQPWALEFGPAGRVLLVCFPFVASGHTYDPVSWATRAFAKATPKSTVVTFSHLHVPGVQPGEETKELPRGREVVFPGSQTVGAAARVQFHYHRRQVHDPGDGGPPIHVVGSLQALTFGEERNEPGFLIVEVPDAI